jgi:membrane protein implicated in regulation of membrane protease activity
MKHHHHQMLSVWFFIGLLLLTYGVIVLSVSLLEYSHPAPVVLANEHLNVWAGVLLMLFGVFYTVRFRPRRKRRDESGPQ